MVALVKEFEIAEPGLLTGPQLSRGGTGELGDKVFHKVQDDGGAVRVCLRQGSAFFLPSSRMVSCLFSLAASLAKWALNQKQP